MTRTYRYFVLLLAALLLLVCFDASAQRYKKRPSDDGATTEKKDDPIRDSTAWQKIKRKLVFGGGGGLAFGGGGASYVELSPLLGYRITEKLQAGIGVTYIHASGTRYYFDQYGNVVYADKYKTNIYGGRLYSQYDITKSIFAHGEYEVLNLDYYNYILGRNERIWIGNPFIGGGFRSMVGAHSSINLMVLYNLNWSQNRDYSPYQIPVVIRVNFSM